MESIRIDGGSDNAELGMSVNVASEFKTTIFVHTVDLPNDDDDGIVERL